jgi:methyl-accepting chemotaxis protein
LRAGGDAAASQAAHDEKLGALRAQLQAKRAEWDGVQQRERTIMYVTYATMLFVVFIVTGGIYWLLMTTVVRPLQGMVSVANVVASGDLTKHIEVRSGDEIGKVMQALRDMNGSLSTLIGKIRAASQSIGDSTQQISTASDGLLRHVEGQTDFLHKTATTLRELAAAVSSNADNAGRARKLAASAREVAIKGGAEVGQAVDTMISISTNSKKIVDIVSIINGITFQTNILALNAAVEAARAGEQGRGFAVVAAEVRNLAQRSATAAKEVADLINTSVRELQEGSGLVEKAGSTMTQIVGGARAVDDIMVVMAGDAERQRQVIEQVRATVDRVDQTSQQQALLANASEAAESMRLQVQQLITAVSAFRLSLEAQDATAIRTAGAPQSVRIARARALA